MAYITTNEKLLKRRLKYLGQEFGGMVTVNRSTTKPNHLSAPTRVFSVGSLHRSCQYH